MIFKKLGFLFRITSTQNDRTTRHTTRTTTYIWNTTKSSTKVRTNTYSKHIGIPMAWWKTRLWIKHWQVEPHLILCGSTFHYFDGLNKKNLYTPVFSSCEILFFSLLVYKCMNVWKIFVSLQIYIFPVFLIFVLRFRIHHTDILLYRRVYENCFSYIFYTFFIHHCHCRIKYWV